jgi:hypothetical protein
VNKTKAIGEAELVIDAIQVLFRANPISANVRLIAALRAQVERLIAIAYLGSDSILAPQPVAEPLITIEPQQ